MATEQKLKRWYPSKQQLAKPEELERAMRQVLKQHYDLVDRHNDLLDRVGKLSVAGGTSSQFPPGSGPADTLLLGLRVLPVDTQTLADGATLKFVKAQANFQFS